MSVRRSVAWMTAAQASAFIIQFGGTVVLARLLTPHDMGIFAIALAVVGLLTAFQTLGLNNLIVREDAADKALTRTVFTLNLVLEIVLAGAIAGAGAFGGVWLGDQGVRDVLLLLAIPPLIGIFDFLPSASLERSAGFRTIAILKVGRILVSTGVTVGFALAGWSYLSLAYGQVITALLNAVVLNIVGWRYVSLRMSLAKWRYVTQFGVHILLTSGVTGVSSKVSEIALSKIIDLAALGLFSRASNIFNLLWKNIHMVLTRVVLVDLAHLAREKASIRERYLKIIEVMTGILWPAFGGLAVLANPFIRIVYGERWTPAAMPLTMLCIAAIFLVSISMTWEIFVVSKATGRQAKLEFIRVAVSLPLFVAGSFVSLTAAAASRIGESIFAIFLYRADLERMTGATARDLVPLYRRSGICAVAAIAPALVLMIWAKGASDVPILAVAGVVLLGMVLWLAALRAMQHQLYSELQRLLRPLRR